MNTNFYSLIDCNIESSVDEINNRYKQKINKYITDNSISDFNQNIKNDIKLLKMAKYILTDKVLRKKYDLIITSKINDANLNSDSNTASRKDFKLSLTEKNDLLSDRIFERFNF
jgi:DnaJ-class molecular chaperone